MAGRVSVVETAAVSTHAMCPNSCEQPPRRKLTGEGTSRQCGRGRSSQDELFTSVSAERGLDRIIGDGIRQCSADVSDPQMGLPESCHGLFPACVDTRSPAVRGFNWLQPERSVNCRCSSTIQKGIWQHEVEPDRNSIGTRVESKQHGPDRLNRGLGWRRGMSPSSWPPCGDNGQSTEPRTGCGGSGNLSLGPRLFTQCRQEHLGPFSLRCSHATTGAGEASCAQRPTNTPSLATAPVTRAKQLIFRLASSCYVLG